jgi:hypothetical protein
MLFSPLAASQKAPKCFFFGLKEVLGVEKH